MTWNDAQYKGGATGGGYSNYFKTPAWQTGANSNPYRGVPDIAGNASGYSGYDLFVYGKKTSELNAMNAKIAPTYAGTSAVAPLYAGLMALINANLFPTNITTATSVGFLNPTLYDLGAKNASFVFQDVSDGLDNGFNGVPGYQSVAGWDPCTGWGSIGGAQLLEAILVGYIAQNPGCMAAIKKFLGMGG
jgi:kumamolisin